MSRKTLVNVPPRYLAITLNDIDEARAALLVLRGGDVELVEAELEEMRAEGAAEKEPDMTILELLSSAKLRVALVICIVLHLSQQFCGIR